MGKARAYGYLSLVRASNRCTANSIGGSFGSNQAQRLETEESLCWERSRLLRLCAVAGHLAPILELERQHCPKQSGERTVTEASQALQMLEAQLRKRK